jgi:hypothetical protein
LCRHKEKNQKKKLVACGIIRPLLSSSAPGFLDLHDAKNPSGASCGAH